MVTLSSIGKKVSELTVFLNRALGKYKQQHVLRVVDRSIEAALVRAQIDAPEAFAALHSLALSVMQKTYDNPTPIIKLVEATSQVLELYGPAIEQAINEYKGIKASNDEHPDFVAAVQAVTESIRKMNSDVQKWGEEWECLSKAE